MQPIEFRERPRIGADVSLPFYPARLPGNPELRTERVNIGERLITIRHKLLRRAIKISAGATTLALVGSVVALVSGHPEVAVGIFGVGVLAGKVNSDIADDYNQRLKDAGHPFVQTRGIR